MGSWTTGHILPWVVVRISSFLGFKAYVPCSDDTACAKKTLLRSTLSVKPACLLSAIWGYRLRSAVIAAQDVCMQTDAVQCPELLG